MVAESALEAAKVGNLPLLESLKSNQSLNERVTDSFGATCVHYAARSGNLDILIYLIEKCSFSGSVKSKIGATPAHDAAATGHLECLQWLLKNTECGVSDKDASGAGLLHLAARFGHNQIVKYLLEETLCPATEATNVGALPLHFASIRGNLNSVKLLVKHAPTTINAQMKNGVTAAYLACQEGYLNVLKYLVLQAGASVIIPANDGMTCVHSAAQNGILDVLIWLIVDQGCDINCRDKEGTTAIHFAASRGHTQVLRWLLLHGGRILLDNLNGTPLHDAAEHGQMESISILLDHGCDASIADNNLLTAAELADHCLHRDCSSLIRKHLEKFPGDHKIPPPPESPAPTLQPEIRMSVDGRLSPNDDRLHDPDDITSYDLPPTSSPRMVYHDKNRMPAELGYRGITHIEDPDAEQHYVSSRRASNQSIASNASGQPGDMSNPELPTMSLQERAAAYQHSVSTTNHEQGRSKFLPNQGQSLIQDFSYVPRRLSQSMAGTSSPSSGIHSNCTTPNDETPIDESIAPSSVNIQYYENLKNTSLAQRATIPRLKSFAPPPPPLPVFFASRAPISVSTSRTNYSVTCATVSAHSSRLVASSTAETNVTSSRENVGTDTASRVDGDQCPSSPEKPSKSAFELAILRQKMKMEGNNQSFRNQLQEKLSRDQTPPPPPPCPPPAPPSGDDPNKKYDPKDPDQCVRPSKLFGAMQKTQGKKPNPDLIEELKQLNVTSLKKVQKTSPVVFDSGTAEPQQSPVGPNILTKTPTTPSNTPSDIPAKNLEDVPTVDKNGREIPEWRRQLMARQKTEKTQAEQADMAKLVDIMFDSPISTHGNPCAHLSNPAAAAATADSEPTNGANAKDSASAAAPGGESKGKSLGSKIGVAMTSTLATTVQLAKKWHEKPGKSEEDKALQDMPSWKREMILRKRADGTKKADEPPTPTSPPAVEDDPDMPPWKREFLSRKKNNQN